jgi:hypothetical protein
VLFTNRRICLYQVSYFVAGLANRAAGDGVEGVESCILIGYIDMIKQ